MKTATKSIKKALDIVKRSGVGPNPSSRAPRPPVLEVPTSGDAAAATGQIPVITPPSQEASNPMFTDRPGEVIPVNSPISAPQNATESSPRNRSGSWSSFSSSDSDDDCSSYPKQGAEGQEDASIKAYKILKSAFKNKERTDSISQQTGNTPDYGGYSLNQLEAISQLCEVIRQKNKYESENTLLKTMGRAIESAGKLIKGSAGGGEQKQTDLTIDTGFEEWIRHETNCSLNNIVKYCSPLVQDNYDLISVISKRLMTIDHLIMLKETLDYDVDSIINLRMVDPTIWEEAPSNFEVFKRISESVHKEHYLEQLDAFSAKSILESHQQVMDIFTQFDSSTNALLLYIAGTRKSDVSELGKGISELGKHGHIAHTSQILKLINFLTVENFDPNKLQFSTLKYLTQHCPNLFCNKCEILRCLIPGSAYQNLGILFKTLHRQKREGLNGDIVKQVITWSNSRETLSVQEQTRIYFKLQRWEISKTRDNCLTLPNEDKLHSSLKDIVTFIKAVSENPDKAPGLNILPYCELMQEFLKLRRHLDLVYLKSGLEESRNSTNFLLETVEDMFAISVLELCSKDKALLGGLSHLDVDYLRPAAKDQLREHLINVPHEANRSILESPDSLNWLRKCFNVLHGQSSHHTPEGIMNYDLNQLVGYEPFNFIVADKKELISKHIIDEKNAFLNSLEFENNKIKGLAKHLIGNWDPDLPSTTKLFAIPATLLVTAMASYLGVDSANILTLANFEQLAEQLSGILQKGIQNSLSQAEISRLVEAKLETILRVVQENLPSNDLRTASAHVNGSPQMPVDPMSQSLTNNVQSLLNPNGGGSVFDMIGDFSGESKSGKH